MSLAAYADLWYAILVLLLFLYVGLGGMDLGVCLLSFLARDGQQAEAMLESIDGVWHANLTWLVILGGALFGAFPLVYATLLSSQYMALLLLLVAIIVRGIALEYREHASNRRPWRNLVFLGSLLILAAQGLILGAYLQGAGAGCAAGGAGGVGALLAMALVLCVDLLMAGAWLLGRMRDAAGPLARWALGLGTVGTLGLGVLFIRAVLGPDVPLETLTPWYLPLGILGLVGLWQLVHAAQTPGAAPLPWALLLLGACMAAFFATLHPVILPPAVLAEDAAAPAEALAFLGIGFAVLLPVLLAANVYQYRVLGRGAPRA